MLSLLLDKEKNLMKTLAMVANEFLCEPGLSSNTLRAYSYTLTPFVEKYGAIAIDNVDKETIRSYLKSLTHLSCGSHNQHQTIIKRLFNYAIAQEYIDKNPVLGIKKRSPNSSKGEHKSDEVIRYLNQEQLKLLKDALKERLGSPEIYRLYCIVSLLHNSGARISELLGLNVDTINYRDRSFIVIGKGNKKRTCFYGETTAELLKTYLEYYRYNDPVALFTAQHPKSLKVTRLSYRTVNKDWKSITRNIPILKDARLHDLRHTFATERVGLMGIEELRALMGHENIQTTLRYQKVTSARARSVAQQALLELNKSSI